jgi:hypothetical protein
MRRHTVLIGGGWWRLDAREPAHHPSTVQGILDGVTLMHGTKHPYKPGDALVPGGIVAGCSRTEDGEPTPGCNCGCDGRWMICATSAAADALHAAERRVCLCGDASADHRPRVFEVTLDDPEPDPNGWGEESVMAATGRIVRELDMSDSLRSGGSEGV